MACLHGTVVCCLGLFPPSYRSVGHGTQHFLPSYPCCWQLLTQAPASSLLFLESCVASACRPWPASMQKAETHLPSLERQRKGMPTSRQSSNQWKRRPCGCWSPTRLLWPDDGTSEIVTTLLMPSLSLELNQVLRRSRRSSGRNTNRT